MISFIQEGAMQEVVAVVEDAKVLGSCRSLHVMLAQITRIQLDAHFVEKRLVKNVASNLLYSFVCRMAQGAETPVFHWVGDCGPVDDQIGMRARDFLALDCFLGAELTGSQELQFCVGNFKQFQEGSAEGSTSKRKVSSLSFLKKIRLD